MTTPQEPFLHGNETRLRVSPTRLGVASKSNFSTEQSGIDGLTPTAGTILALILPSGAGEDFRMNRKTPLICSVVAAVKGTWKAFSEVRNSSVAPTVSKLVSVATAVAEEARSSNVSAVRFI